MALVVIHAPKLTSDQKKRIGDRIFEALHSEGIPASSTILLFKREEADILLDGGLLVEAGCEIEAPEDPTPARQETSSFQAITITPTVVQDYKMRARRTKAELSELKSQLVASLQIRGHLSSFQAQEVLGLKDCEWAPATLRRLFGELEEEGLIAKQGQKRGTRYVWNGITSHSTSPTPILVKRDSDLLDEDEDEVVLVGQ